MHLQRASILSVCAMFVGPAPAQTNSNDSTIQALLIEVRQLRQALERSAVVAPRIQVTLQRIQLQQDQVSRLSRQVEDVRDRIAQSASDTARATTELKLSEGRLEKELDPLRRKTMEDELRAKTSHLESFREQQSVDEEKQRARESELSGRLRTEQGKLDELNDHLNVLERLLESPQPKQP
jgi:chromosome segregation ATPase